MGNANRYHIISRSGEWALKREGSTRAAAVYQSKSKATDASKKFQNKNYDVVIHRTDGTITEWRRGK